MNYKNLATAFFIILCAVGLNAQTWTRVANQTLPSFSGSFFLNANTGWFVAAKGGIQKTVDGGKTWMPVNAGIVEDLKSVYFRDDNTGYIGSATKLYKSTDGFATWDSVTVTGTIASPSYHGVYFSDALNGWFLSSSSSLGRVLRTTNGGSTWSTVVDNTAGNLQTMRMYNATSGMASGGGVGKCDIYYTKTGSTWTKATAPTFPSGYSRTDIKGIHIVDTNLAYGTGWGSLVGAQASIHIKSTDGGATWTYLTQDAANKTFDNLYDLYFKDALTGLVAGGGTKTGLLLKTTNGGTSWVPMVMPCGSQISRIFGFGDNVIAATAAGAFFSSKDFGASWELVTPIPICPLQSIFAVNNNVIYAGGQDGILLKTTDGGKTWKSSYQRVNNSGDNIQGLYFVNENVGYSANSYRLIAKTTDGGTTWSAVLNDSTDATSTNYGVHFINENTGFVVGKAGNSVDVVYKTTNGGVSWTTTTYIVSANLRGVAFYDAQNGIAVGEKVKAMFTKNGGATWTASTINGVPAGSASATIREVVYVNATTAVAAGDKLFIKTTDGGTTWNYVSVTVEHSLTGIAGSSSNLWAVGLKSASPKSVGILQSMDEGASWTNKVTSPPFDTTNTVVDVSVAPSGAVYIAAGQSSIYTSAVLTTGPVLSLLSKSIDFGPVKVGIRKDTVVAIKNTGDETLNVSAILSSNASSFLSARSSLTVAPGATVMDTISFAPQSGGSATGKIVLTSNAPSLSDTITVLGYGATTGITYSTKTINFGTVKVGLKKDSLLTITNTGNQTLSISKIESSSPVFSVSPVLFTVDAGANVKDTIRFAPTAVGQINANILITHNAGTQDTVAVTGNGTSTGVEDNLEMSAKYSLGQNYPNPFNPATTISYQLPEKGSVSLKVYDVLGKEIATVVNGLQEAGYYTVQFDASKFSTGIYFYRFQAHNYTEMKKMLLMK